MVQKKIGRRTFLKYLSAGTCGAAIHHTVASKVAPGFVRQALAQSASGAAVSDALLYVINLSGGASCNISPIYHSGWRDRNPTTSFSEAASLPLNNEQGLHPALPFLQQLYEDGDLALLNEVGFPNGSSSRSHNFATNMWMTAHARPNNQSGVLNQLSCQIGGLFGAVSVAGSAPIVEGICSNTRTISSVTNITEPLLYRAAKHGEWLNIQRKRIRENDTFTTTGHRSMIRDAISSTEQVIEAFSNFDTAAVEDLGIAPPETSFGRDLNDVALLTAAGESIGSEAFYLRLGGFDHHSDERAGLTSRLEQLNSGIQFLTEVNKALGVWDRTVILIMTEFGRTFENNSAGSDHGHTCPAFLIGGRVNGRVVNAAPSNTKILGASGFLTSPEIDPRNLWRQVIVAMGYDPDLVISDTGYDQSDLGLFV